MEGIRTLLLAGAIGTMMAGSLYAGVHYERTEASAEATTPEVMPRDPAPPVIEAPVEAEPKPPVEEVFDPSLSIGIDLADEAELFPAPEDIVLTSGFRIGPAAFGVFDEPPLPDAEETAEAEAETPARRRARRTPPRPPGPRLHSDPGMHSILTARRMMANGERIQGSCYKYLSEVYERAGHRSWRKRRIVYRAEREGPYADLDLVRPGDWLYIVNDPGRTPVGTHSVMFVRWTDRANGYASVISHPGWGSPHTGAERTYDLSRTYRIIRPTM